MNAKELRQAAERILASCSTRFGEGVFSLASHILATVQEDGEEILTDEWLSSIGGEVFEYENDPGRCYCFHMDNDVTLNIEVSSRTYLWDVGNDHIVCELKPITTRSQFRSLMKGLGIDPKNKSQKTINFS